MCFKQTLIPAVLAGGLAVGQTGLAEDAADTIKELRQQIEQLDQKVKVLERKRELEQEAATERTQTATSVSAGASGFTLRSADTNFVLKIRGYLQADARFYPDDH